MYPNYLPALAGAGMLALILWIVLAFVGFVISAFIMNLFVRLVIRFMRKSLDREYRYMRGDYTDYGTRRAPNTVPRNW
jgi:hypothetical protein